MWAHLRRPRGFSLGGCQAGKGLWKQDVPGQALLCLLIRSLLLHSGWGQATQGLWGRQGSQDAAPLPPELLVVARVGRVGVDLQAPPREGNICRECSRHLVD